MIVSMSKSTNHETNEQTERKAAFSSATKDVGVCFQTAQKQGGHGKSVAVRFSAKCPQV